MRQLPGFYLPNDSAILANIKESQHSKFARLSIDTTYFKDGHRVMELGGMMAEAPIMLKAHYEFRGNRWYALLAMYDPKKDNPVVDRFFSSFKMLEYTGSLKWKQHTPDDALFTTGHLANLNLLILPIHQTLSAAINTIALISIRADDYT